MTNIQASVAALLASLAGCTSDPASTIAPTDQPQAVRLECAAVSDASDAEVVRSRALQLVPKSVKLWPPNHKLHEISVEDCVEIIGTCPGETLEPHFIWASSDEPVDAKGDGHHAPDITLSADCRQLSLRSERQGPSDGRVYTLGVRLVDASGETHEAACSVSVDHDQRGQDATAGADAYQIEFDGTSADFPDCGDGVPELL